MIAVSDRGTMFNPGPCVYMEKLAVGPKAVGSVDVRRSPTENLEAVAKALGKSTARRHRRHPRPAPPRRAHRRGARCSGARIKLISDGDVAGRHLGGVARLGRRRPVRHRGNPRRGDRRRRAQVHGRRDPGAAVPPRRRRARRGAGGGLRPRCGARAPTTSSRATTASSPPPPSPTASCSRVCATTTTASPPSPWSCGRDRGRCASSAPATPCNKLREYSQIEFG